MKMPQLPDLYNFPEKEKYRLSNFGKYYFHIEKLTIALGTEEKPLLYLFHKAVQKEWLTIY